MTIFKKFRFLLIRYFFHFFSFKIISWCLNFISMFLHTYKLKITHISWLDMDSKHIIKTISPSLRKLSYCPTYIHKQTSNCSVEIPPIQVYHFKEPIINIDSSSFWLINTLLTERIPYINPSLCNYSSGYLLLHDEKKALIKESRTLISIDKGIFLGGNGSWNYYHWMIEILPKLQFLDQLPPKLRNFPILLSEEVKTIPTFFESLQTFSIENPIIYLKRQQNYCVKDLIYISAVNNLAFNVNNKTIIDASFSFVRSSSLLYLRNAFFSYYHDRTTQLKSVEKIFLARKNRNRSYNQDEVFAALRPYGFIEIYMEDYTLIEQIHLFKNARFIVGPTGAAWTNIIFCSSNVKCLCWMAEEQHDFSGFSNLAAYSNVILNYITFQTNEQQSKLHSASYNVDVKHIEFWLQLNMSN